MRGELCQVLAEDPDLGRGLTPERHAMAEERLLARVIRLGEADVERLGAGELVPREPEAKGAGFLVLEGLLLRRVGISGRFGAEVIGAGDLLRPWQGEDEEPSLPAGAAWRVLQECRLAVLDTAFLSRMAPFPELYGELLGRALRRSRHLATLMAIVHQPRLDVRLHMLLWQLADRWGRVTADGVRLPIPLSHGALAELVAARRPSVTTALGRLVAQGVIRDERGGWLLQGERPVELNEMGTLAGAPGSVGAGPPS